MRGSPAICVQEHHGGASYSVGIGVLNQEPLSPSAPSLTRLQQQFRVIGTWTLAKPVNGHGIEKIIEHELGALGEYAQYFFVFKNADLARPALQEARFGN